MFSAGIESDQWHQMGQQRFIQTIYFYSSLDKDSNIQILNSLNAKVSII